MGNINKSNEGEFFESLCLLNAIDNNRYPRNNGCGCSSIISIIICIALIIMIFTSPYKLINNLINGEEVTTSTIFGFIFFVLIIIFFIIAIINRKNGKDKEK